eukprot:TRINITY_DN5127_c0_g1_i1.p1 TRINITY_DN5127_c0_g1~~TRINITY_DN5127_c0_g1_i1.p1  ORF type:complete len:118 (-),score=19.83 TRINITY_DN5127_c0_g1_i1:186-539(-)
MIRRPPRSTLSSSSAASDVYKRQLFVWVGELVTLSSGSGMSISSLVQSLQSDFFQAVSQFRSMLLCAIIGWSVCTPFACVLLYYTARPLCRYLIARPQNQACLIKKFDGQDQLRSVV